MLIHWTLPVKRTLKTKQELVPEDHVLLTPFVKADEKVIGKTRTNVSWLRRTEYISSEGRVFGKAKYVHTNTVKRNLLKPGNHRAQKAKELSAEVLEDDSLESRIRAIEQSFVFANKTSLLSLKHPTNPSITAQEIFPVFPDFEFWPNQYTLASYDMDPMSKEFSRSGQV